MSNFGIRKLIVFSQQQSFLESKRPGKKETVVKLRCWLFHLVSKIHLYSVISYSLDRSFN